MGRSLAILVLSSLAVSSLALVQLSYARSGQTADEPAGQPSTRLPSTPPGKSTVIGGAIRDVDPVRDQFTLKIFGARSMKILYDERTQLYRDGVKIPLRDLRADEHASVETLLDGTNVFAVSIHILSQSPEGEVHGQVLNYNPATGVLTVSDPVFREPVELQVPTGTPVVRVGQAAAGPSDLHPGTLVAIKFKPGNEGRGVTSQIEILATPGSAFVFTGNVSFVDLHSGRLVLIDPRDDQNYQVSFDPARLPASRDLHEGSHVTVTADFDGARYVARAITIN
jgi:hypothetical protein